MLLYKEYINSLIEEDVIKDINNIQISSIKTKSGFTNISTIVF